MNRAVPVQMTQTSRLTLWKPEVVRNRPHSVETLPAYEQLIAQIEVIDGCTREDAVAQVKAFEEAFREL